MVSEGRIIQHEYNVPTLCKTLLILGGYVSILLSGFPPNQYKTLPTLGVCEYFTECGFPLTQSKTLPILGGYVSILLSVDFHPSKMLIK